MPAAPGAPSTVGAVSVGVVMAVGTAVTETAVGSDSGVVVAGGSSACWQLTAKNRVSRSMKK